MTLHQRGRFLRYLFFGGLNTALTFSLYILLLKTGLNYLFASTICYAVGIIEGFLFNAWFVFHHKPRFSGLTKYGLVYAVAYLINLGLLFGLVHFMELDKIVAQLVTIIVVTILNFKLVQQLVFKGGQ